MSRSRPGNPWTATRRDAGDGGDDPRAHGGGGGVGTGGGAGGMTGGGGGVGTGGGGGGTTGGPGSPPSTWDRILRFCLEQKLVVWLVTAMAIVGGLMVAPFDWDLGGLHRDPVPVDAIPDIGENQQIVFTEWPGRSPQDVEDQISYPLTTSLMGLPGVRSVRSYSMFGFSTIYVIFEDDIEFYWSRSRILEKLSSLPSGTLPEGVRPTLGPDATALGQVFWYTLEGRDPEGNPAGGWDLDELRSIQDWQVRYALQGVQGVSEVASVGGFVREYQIDVDPDALRAYGVTLEQVADAVRMSNLDVGARTIEINQVEYFIRGLGFLKSVEDIEQTVVGVRENVPVYLGNVAQVGTGPALRRGALDKEGAEAVGGVVVVRHGENPLEVIQRVKAKIAEIAPGLSSRILPDGTLSQVSVIPFYDRTGLIYETLGTLNEAISLEILVTILVVLVMVLHLRSSLLISGLLPLAVLLTFLGMKAFHVDANLVALSGIAIAIGTMVDMGIVVTDNILRRLEQAEPGESSLESVFQAVREVSGAVVTAIATTVVSFLPVFAMGGAEGKLFQPLAYTKTFALIASVLVALIVIPPAAQILFTARLPRGFLRRMLLVLTAAAGVAIGLHLSWWLGALLILVAAYRLVEPRLPAALRTVSGRWFLALLVLAVFVLLTRQWLPLGPERGLFRNLLFTGVLLGGFLLVFVLFHRAYPRILRWCLSHKLLFLSLPALLVLMGIMVWQGFGGLFGWLPRAVRLSPPVVSLAHAFPGLGREFMPPLDEGSYLYMPTTMPHASIGEAMDVLQTLDMAFYRIPEVERAVGKIGRVDSALDPAPISMVETVINYHSEYLLDDHGRRMRFRVDPDSLDFYRSPAGTPQPARDGEPYLVRGAFLRDDEGKLIPDRGGRPFRLWRPPLSPEINPGREAWEGVRNPDDIWDAIVRAGQIPGTTSAPKLQPISTRLVMLQSGMRAPMGIKVRGPDLASVEQAGLELERFLKEVPAVEPSTVFADRIVGKPYLEIEIDRTAIARHGVHVRQVQDVIETALGGKRLTTTVEGRERYPVRIRYLRELRDSMEALERILVTARNGAQIPLGQLAEIRYVRGPQVIKSEDTFLTGYVLFDKKDGPAEVEAVEQARDYLRSKMASGQLVLPAGVSFFFAGSYENQVRAQRKLSIVLPMALAVIFLILYFQFRSARISALVFSGVLVAWAGGFLLLWLYGRPWFLDVSLFGADLRQLFQIGEINLSVAVWVGFLALFGIATDDGVVMATFLRDSFARRRPETISAIRAAVQEAGLRRVRPCLMTTATTILALLPVLTSTGRGSDVMVPMAIPSFGGMLLAMITMFVVPVLFSAMEEARVRIRNR